MKRSSKAHKPLSASGLPPLDEDTEWVLEEEEPEPVVPASWGAPTVPGSGASGTALGITPTGPLARLNSWTEAGVSPELLPGADGHVHLPPPPGHATGSAHGFEEEQGLEGSEDYLSGLVTRLSETGEEKAGSVSGSGDTPLPIAAGPPGRSTSRNNSISKQQNPMRRQMSRESFAPSAVSSAQSGSLFSLGAAASLGLGELDREEWTNKEQGIRSRMLPILKITTDQLDGTIKPKFSHFAKNTSPAENMEKFGYAFYEELFATAPDIRDELFADKATEVLAVKLGMILHEVVRLLALESPRELSMVIAEMALKHIEYGLEARHVEPFKAAMMATLKREVSKKGHKWTSKARAAWVWGLNEVITLLVNATSAGRPKVKLLSQSWNAMVERLHEESAEKTRMKKTKKKKRSEEVDENSDEEGSEEEDSEEEEEEQGALLGGRSKFFSRIGRTAFDLLGGARRRRAKKKGGDGVAVEHKPNDMFQTWRKRDALTDGNPDYLDGRRRVGQTFLDVFAARNAWAVRDFNFGLSETHADKMGLALELIVNSATRPKVLQHKLRVLALGHDQMGIKSAMFPRFGEALFDFLEQVLGAYGLYDDETRDAWEWMWQIVQAAFTRHLDAASRLRTLVSESWEHITCTLDISDISVQFFANLFRVCPELQKLFVKPTKMQTVMLGKAMDLLVRSLSDTHVLDVELKAIAMRHIKYDMNQGHLTAFGHVLLQTLGDMLGPEGWDEDIRDAWADIYFHIAEIFGHVISTGRGLISKALATNDTTELNNALALVPRRQRALAALEIEVDDTVVLPLTWTIEEGQFAMTDAILRDVLALRGDRSSYYYGRALLWAKHPRVVALLAQRAPKLLPTFLDGHMWTSRYVVNGRRRVNFYCRELYGDPRRPENSIVYSTPLGVLVKTLPESELAVFAHPVIVHLVDLKWSQFGRRDFVVLQLLNAGALGAGMIYLQFGMRLPAASFALGVLQLLLCAARSSAYVGPLVKQIRSRTGTAWRPPGFSSPVFVPYVVQGLFFWVNLLAGMASVGLFALTAYEDVFGWVEALSGDRHVLSDAEFAEAHSDEASANLLRIWAGFAAFVAGMLWVQMAESFKLTTQLSALLFALGSVLADVGRFAAVLAVWLLGFSLALYWLAVGENLSDGRHTLEASMYVELQLDGMHQADTADVIYYVLMSTLALTGLDGVLASNWAVRGVYAVAVLATVVVLLNLLMSTMVSTYERMQKHFHELAVKTRAELVLAAEEASSVARRARFFDALYFDKLDFEEEDDGPAGGVQVRYPAETLTHPAYRVLDRVERYVGAASGKMPWDPANRISSAVSLEDTRGVNAGTLKLLKALSSDVVAMAGELFNIKRALKLDNAGAPSVAGTSVNGDELDDEVRPAGDTTNAARAAPAAEPLARPSAVNDTAKTPGKKFADVARKASRESLQAQKEAESGPKKAAASTSSAVAATNDEKKAAAVVAPKNAKASEKAAVPAKPASNPNRKVSVREMASHKTEASLWLSVDGVVHDVTTLLDTHPGGKGVLLRAGFDASESFHSAHQGASLAKARAGMARMPVMGRFQQK